MKCLPSLLLVAALAAGAMTGAQAQGANSETTKGAEPQRVWTPDDFEVYVDRETGFAFIKTPSGWKFIRQIEAEKLALVPAEYFVRVDQRETALVIQTVVH